jgi:hypothetical protein
LKQLGIKTSKIYPTIQLYLAFFIVLEKLQDHIPFAIGHPTGTYKRLYKCLPLVDGPFWSKKNPKFLPMEYFYFAPKPATPHNSREQTTDELSKKRREVSSGDQ